MFRILFSQLKILAKILTIAINQIFTKPSNQFPSNIAARNTIVRHESDLLLNKEDDLLKDGRMPHRLLLSKKKKFYANNPVLWKQLTKTEKKKKDLDDSMFRYFQNKLNKQKTSETQGIF